MVSLKVGICVLLIAAVSGQSIVDEGRLLSKFAEDFISNVDAKVVVKLFDDNTICNIVVPFTSNGAEGYLRLRHLELVASEELVPSAVTIYDVTDDGREYYFNMTYSLSDSAYKAKEAEVVAGGKVTPVRATIKIPLGVMTLKFQKQTIDGKLVIRMIGASLEIPNGTEVNISNVERQLAEYLEQEVAAQIISNIKYTGNYSWYYVADTKMTKGFENAIRKERLVRIPLKVYQSLFNTTAVPLLSP
ncbi:hypothetical protein HDE_07636 [Halotydeus destructor]|nr:hypothetical protein HDE_07636 [Halotydeus destructor]